MQGNSYLPPSHYSLQSNKPPSGHNTPNTIASKNSEETSSRTLYRYRGFSTSISSLFLDETIVCPSIAWCGILSSSRTEHLLYIRDERRKVQGLKPPSRILSVALGILLACIMMTYVIWGFGNSSYSSGGGASSGSYYDGYDNNSYYNNRNLKRNGVTLFNDKKMEYVPHVMRFKDYHDKFWKPVFSIVNDILYQNSGHNTNVFVSSTKGDDTDRLLQSSILEDQELASNIRWILCLLFIILLGIFGRRKRMLTRYALLKARAADDRITYGKAIPSNQQNGRCGDICSHSLCGFYPVDNADEEKSEMEHQDCMNAAMSKFSACCFGMCCKVWCQCFSICAIAQEAREIRLLIPPFVQRVDYITHQPFEEYFRNIYMLRKNYKTSLGNDHGGWGLHLSALSILSRRILIFFVLTTLIIVFTVKFNHLAVFTLADFCILLLTFCQSFVVLGIVHGLFHKSDLSTDAVIKFFATGFMIATTMAFLLEGIIMNLLILILYAVTSVVLFIGGDQSVGSFIDNHYNLLMSLADIIQAFLVAALAEEICKYYTFRAVEHPDLLFLTGLDRHNHGSQAKIGGQEAYPYSSNNASLLGASVGSFDSTFSKNSVHKGHRGHRGDRSITSLGRGKKSSEEMHSQPEIRTLRQKAAAVTTAMISCAVGLACAENFIYIFFLGGHNARDEFTLLFIRSIFPVHALCAAMQSVGVIKKFLEPDVDTHSIGVGWIIFPAVILHGSFDAVLMLVNTYIDIMEANGYETNSVVVNSVAAGCVSSVMILGLIFYYKVNRLQKARLKRFEVYGGPDEPEKEFEII